MLKFLCKEKFLCKDMQPDFKSNSPKLTHLKESGDSDITSCRGTECVRDHFYASLNFCGDDQNHQVMWNMHAMYVKLH